MLHVDPYDFDIDVDLAPLLGRVKEPVLIDSRWYELVRKRPARSSSLQHKLDECWRKIMLQAQWHCARQQSERRRALRVPLVSRVHTVPGNPMVACDISQKGLRCSGRPQSGILDIEFKLPGLAFPIDARAEVVSFKPANVIPLTGLRFVDIDTPYLDHIHRYIERRRSQKLKAA